MKIEGRAGHVVTVQWVWWRGSEQGYASCTCGWTRQDVVAGYTVSKARAHAEAAPAVTLEVER